MSSKDIFNRKPTQVSAKNNSEDQYLVKKTESVTMKSFQSKFLNPDSELKNGQNVRLHKETHALLKSISISKNIELYSIIQEGLQMYLNSLDKKEQKEIWSKLQSLIELNVIKM